MKILVTGANGFIGSNIAERFIKEGFSVRCLVHKNLTWLKNLPVEVYYGNITDPETLIEPTKNVDFVFHCAATLRTIKTETYYEVNHIGTKNLIETVYRVNPNIKRFVYISSQSAMGPSDTYNPKEPNSNCRPVSDYGRSKLFGEEEILKFENKLPITILRPSAVYGPRDTDLLPFFKLVNNFGIFTILTGTKTSFVQLLFVNDLSEICYLITKKSNLEKNIYFLSEKKPYSWREIADVISQTSSKNKKIKIIVLPFRLVKSIAFISEVFSYFKKIPSKLNRDKLKEFSQPYWVADTSQTEQEFEFEFTTLEIGAKITYDWYRENHWV